MKSKYFLERKPRIFAHRGASRHAPENSLPAFERALKHTKYLETDLHSLKDGTLVFHHDADVRRSCGIDRRLNELTLSELKKIRILNSAETIPTASEAFQAFPGAFWNIEIKDERSGIESDVLGLLEKFNVADSVLIAAEKDSIMTRFRALRSGIPTSASHDEMFAVLQWMQAGCIGDRVIEAQAFQLPQEYSGMRLDRAELIQLAHGRGIEVHYWTINDPAVACELIKRGAHGIVTDDPELIKNALG